MTADGRWCRAYITDEPPGRRHYLIVTYHGPVKGRRRQLKVSPRLLARVLSQPA